MPELPDGLVGEATICYDMTYGRGHTPFTRWASAHNAAGVSKGWGMLVEQAAESFLLWRGIRPSTQPVLEALAQN
jgi:shikimate dehydrogenase